MTDLKLPELPKTFLRAETGVVHNGRPATMPAYTAAQLTAYATAAVLAEREQAAVDALAKMIVRQEALTIKTVEGATHHMANWRRAREEARELLSTLNRVADECEKGGGDDAR